MHMGCGRWNQFWISQICVLKRFNIGAICAALILMIPSFPASAYEPLIVDRLSNSSRDIRRYSEDCSDKRREDMPYVYDVGTRGHIFDDMIISPYGATSHVYSTYEFNKREIAEIVIYHPPQHLNAAPMYKCLTVIMINTNGARLKYKKVRGGVRSGLSSEEQSYIAVLKKYCESLGRKAEEVFSLGNEAIDENGVPYHDELGDFSCDAAVLNNTSALIFSFGSRRIRVTTIFDRVYLRD